MKEAIKCLGCSSEKERVIRVLKVCNRPIVRKDRRENLKKRAEMRIKVSKRTESTIDRATKVSPDECPAGRNKTWRCCCRPFAFEYIEMRLHVSCERKGVLVDLPARKPNWYGETRWSMASLIRLLRRAA